MNEMSPKKWINLKFCVKFGKTTSETLLLLKMANGEHDIFLSGKGDSNKRENTSKMMREVSCLKHKKHLQIWIVWNLVGLDRRLGVQLIEELNLNRETTQGILIEDLGIGKMSLTIVSRIQTDKQK